MRVLPFPLFGRFSRDLRPEMGGVRHTETSLSFLNLHQTFEAMLKRHHRGAVASSHPFRLRMLALFCLLTFGLASSVQTVHIHGDWLPSHAAKVGAPADASQLPGGEEHCPLCTAMHSVLPETERTMPEPVAVRGPVVAQSAVTSADAQWHFALFSRPPPVVQHA
jgi:hypothetical protein